MMKSVERWEKMGCYKPIIIIGYLYFNLMKVISLAPQGDTRYNIKKMSSIDLRWKVHDFIDFGSLVTCTPIYLVFFFRLLVAK